MNLARSFLADIADHPDDDAPRLIFADWLDENGEPERAELIRVQCRLVLLTDDGPEQRRLQAREKDLLALHQADWRPALPEFKDVLLLEFRRGFIEGVRADTVDAFLAAAPALFEAAPIKSVQIKRIDPSSARRLADSPHLAQLNELNLGNQTGVCRKSIQALAHSRHIKRLQSLLLYNNSLGDQGIDPLIHSTQLAELRELYLSGTGLTGAGVSALASSGCFTHLTHLDLRDNHIGDRGAEALASSEGLDRLTMPLLVNTRIGPAGAMALAKTDRLPALNCLYLNHNPIGDAGVEALANSRQRSGLVELDLRGCGIGDQGGRALAASPYLDKLRILWIDGNHMRRETLTLLRQRFGKRIWSHDAWSHSLIS